MAVRTWFYERFIERHPDHYSFAFRNVYRSALHYVDPRRSWQQCEIILTQDIMHPYILNLLGGFSNDDRPVLARRLIKASEDHAALPSVWAACLIHAGDVYHELGLLDRAHACYQTVIDSKRASDDYRDVASSKLRLSGAGKDPRK